MTVSPTPSSLFSFPLKKGEGKRGGTEGETRGRRPFGPKAPPSAAHGWWGEHGQVPQGVLVSRLS